LVEVSTNSLFFEITFAFSEGFEIAIWVPWLVDVTLSNSPAHEQKRKKRVNKGANDKTTARKDEKTREKKRGFLIFMRQMQQQRCL